MTFIFEQSDTEIYASHADLVVAGPIINRHSGLKKRLKSIPLHHGIAHIDLVWTYLGLLCQGKNDFEAVEGIRKDPFFQQACRVPCDYIPKRSYPLFRTRQILNDWLTQNLEEA